MNLFPVKFWWFRLKGRSRTSQSRQRRWGRHTLWAYRSLLGLLVIGLFTYFSPYQRPYNVPQLRLGSTSPQKIPAPFRFTVPKSDEEQDREEQEAMAAVPMILDINPLVGEEQIANLDSVFRVLLPTIRLQMAESMKQRHLRSALSPFIGGLSDAALVGLIRVLGNASPPYTQDFQGVCRQILSEIYGIGVLASKAPILNSITRQVHLGRGQDARKMDVETLFSVDELKQGKLLAFTGRYRTIADRDAVEIVHELLSLFITPNIVVDLAETARLRDEAKRGVAPTKRLYRPGEVIIENDATVTTEHLEALDALAEAMAEQELQNPIKLLMLTIAAAIICSFLILFFGYYLATREPLVFARPGHLLLLALFGVATASIGSYIRTHELVPYLIPTPLPAMLATILFNSQIGLVLSFVLALFAGSLFGDFYLALTCALTSAVAIYSVRHVRHRNQFYRAMILLPISYSLLIGAADLLRFIPLGKDFYDHILIGIFTGVAAPILTIGLLPIFESLFHITTDITLLELSDLNRPLLRELAIRAPGTYTHSLIMANLSESAAEAIGANALLARVGCYYHDIGKMLKPEYFTENQGLRGGRNPHDHLTPNMSMLIITSHVKDGLELADEHGLPRAISDLIPQHHGTTVIEYFYNRAVELGDENVRKDDFRYDGPPPQTKEAGIVMLADSVESAARTLSERTPNRVRQLVRKIIQQKFNAGELNECALTLQDLHKIEDSFIPILMGTLHGRVEYPWQKAEKKRIHPTTAGTSRE